MNTILGIVFILFGLFATLTGFDILRPFQNDAKKKAQIERHKYFYKFGGLAMFLYGIFKLYNGQ
jgi:SNF family Na+-dependent transporter